jgi:hypothetical protein
MKPNQHTGMLSAFRPPLCFELTGKELYMDFDDGYDRTVTFKDRKVLSFGLVGEEKDFPYECMKIALKICIRRRFLYAVSEYDPCSVAG